MGTRPGLSLLVPVIALWAADVALTLAGQSHGYWSGDYSLAEEGNWFVRPALARGPAFFVGVTAALLVVQCALVLKWWQPFATWLAVGVAVAHAVGAASWLLRLGPWGWLAAGIFLVLAAEGSAWCWRRGQSDLKVTHAPWEQAPIGSQAGRRCAPAETGNG